MSFTADWLALRAGADQTARDDEMVAELAAIFKKRDSIRVLDLGAGTGASLAALSGVLPDQQTWVLADNDGALLDQITAPGGVTLDKQVMDLSGSLAQLFDPAPDLVTASAFFDLCGSEVADRLVARVAEAGAVFYTALTYDGWQEWQPPHPLDESVIAGFNADQRRDKGLGPAMGLEATEHLAAAFRKRRYTVTTAASDWELEPPDHAALIAELARGTADVMAPVLGTEQAAEWHRMQAKAEEVTIGHQDLLAIPPR